MDHGTTARRGGKAKRPAWKGYLRGGACLLLILGAAVAEYFVVSSIYENVAYRDAMALWNCGGSIEANRRAPDPVYQEPVLPDVSDELFDELTADSLIDVLPSSPDDGGEAEADSLSDV